jgi:hypothetical protein
MMITVSSAVTRDLLSCETSRFRNRVIKIGSDRKNFGPSSNFISSCWSLKIA